MVILFMENYIESSVTSFSYWTLLPKLKWKKKKGHITCLIQQGELILCSCYAFFKRKGFRKSIPSLNMYPK